MWLWRYSNLNNKRLWPEEDQRWIWGTVDVTLAFQTAFNLKKINKKGMKNLLNISKAQCQKHSV